MIVHTLSPNPRASHTKHHRLHAAIAGIAILVTFVHPAVSRAEPDSDEGAEASTVEDRSGRPNAARAHFKAAQSLYEAGSFIYAAEEFQKAYDLTKSPEILYNIYVAYRDAGELEQAAKYLREYLEQVPDAPDRPNLEAKLRTLDRLIEEPRKERDAGDTDNAGSEADPHPEGAGSVNNDRSEPQGGSNFVSGTLPWILMGVGGAALVAGAVTGIISLNKTSNIAESCPNNSCPTDFDLDGSRSDARTFTTLTDVLLIGGGITAVTGLVLLFVLADDSKEVSSEDSYQFNASCSTAFCGASVQGRF